MKLRKEVLWFAEQMEIELRKHDNRPGWKGSGLIQLLERLEEELGELHDEIYLNPMFTKKIIKEAADVANFAMMIADIADSGEEKYG